LGNGIFGKRLIRSSPTIFQPKLNDDFVKSIDISGRSSGGGKKGEDGQQSNQSTPQLQAQITPN